MLVFSPAQNEIWTLIFNDTHKCRKYKFIRQMFLLPLLQKEAFTDFEKVYAVFRYHKDGGSDVFWYTGSFLAKYPSCKSKLCKLIIFYITRESRNSGARLDVHC
jgi:hypothetical protein